MRYRLFTLMSGLCLLASGLLALASRPYRPGTMSSLGGRPGDRGAVLIHNGVVSIGRGGGHYLLSVAFSELAIVLTLPALAWGLVTLRRLRRQRRKPLPGFPVQPPGQHSGSSETTP